RFRERLAVGRLLGLLVGAAPAREHDGLALEVIGALPPCIERQRDERQRGRGSAGQDGAACGLGHLSLLRTSGSRATCVPYISCGTGRGAAARARRCGRTARTFRDG